VSVPDGGTLLLGGQKLAGEVNKESGVPGLSKTPILGRLFSNRSKVKDQDILLILVKPSIILQDEAEREYFAPLE
jgi:type II secretory pathway component GspD/PulD (secretin)